MLEIVNCQTVPRYALDPELDSKDFSKSEGLQATKLSFSLDIGVL